MEQPASAEIGFTAKLQLRIGRSRGLKKFGPAVQAGPSLKLENWRRTVESVLEALDKSQQSAFISREDRRLLLGASLRPLRRRFTLGKRILKSDLIRVTSFADGSQEWGALPPSPQSTSVLRKERNRNVSLIWKGCVEPGLMVSWQPNFTTIPNAGMAEVRETASRNFGKWAMRSKANGKAKS